MARDDAGRRKSESTSDRAGALDGWFWDAVVLTAANDRQAETYVQQLDALHARGQLPGTRERYLVISDPPGPRVGSGGATLHVMLRLQALVGSGWSAKKLFLLHAGGYSERSPAHGTLGKAFGQIPFDAAGVGVPATVLETQLVSFQELPSRLPSGIFVSSADVAVQFGALPRLGPAAIARAEQGILALAHASSVEVGTGHGVFVCDREQLDACVRGAVAGADAGAAAGDAAVACRRCLQKPSVAAMRASSAEVSASTIAALSSRAARTAASAGRHRTCDSRSDSVRASSSSGKIHTFVPDRGRSTASGDAAAAAIASGFALSSDARSASESAKKGTPSSPTNEAPEGAGGEITARAETARRAGGHEGDRSPARDTERGGARCARALGGAVAAAPDIVECAVGQCADRRPNENV